MKEGKLVKYTVITGASSGIGYASALGFAKRGCNIVLVARRKERLAELKKHIEQEAPGVDCLVRQYDLSDIANCFALYDSLKGVEIETWINNAGVGIYGTVAEHDISAIRQMLHINVEALTVLSNLYVKDYRDVPGTQLINVSSAGGYTIVQNAVTYCATKFYVSVFTEGLAVELKNQNAKLKAKVLAPFLTQTEFAKVANSNNDFDYEKTYRRFHTSDEMAELLLELYDSDRVVGRVSREDFSFSLSDGQCSHASPSK